METEFKDQIRNHVRRLGPHEAARICDVTIQTIYLWMRGFNNTNLCTRVGALNLLGAEKTKKNIKPWIFKDEIGKIIINTEVTKPRRKTK